MKRRRCAVRRPQTFLFLCVLLLLGSAADGETHAEGTVDCQGIQPNGWYVRCEVNGVSQQWLDDMRAGVAKMKSRPATDPRSWTYQANMHGVPRGSGSACPAETAADQPAWNTCQHGNFFFLAWHRMYLFYFERILRDAVYEATGRKGWSLPYWDYEKFPALPAAFRAPADATNALYVAERSADCNNGSSNCLPSSVTSATEALATKKSCSCTGAACDWCYPGLQPNATFHGGWVPGPTHDGAYTGELEAQPHNVVHATIGGPGGWMSYVECAARDPIFWLHHANIDRLWQVWVNEDVKRVNLPYSAEWRTQKFTFVDIYTTDPKGWVLAEKTGCDVLNTIWQLDYKYDTVNVPVYELLRCDELHPASSPRTGDGKPQQGVPQGTLVSIPPARVLAVQRPEQPLVLGAGGASLALQVPVEAEASIGPQEEYRVVLDELELVTPGAVYQVYLNLPPGVPPDPEDLYFVGNLALFGHASGGGGGHEPALHTRSFDVSPHVWAAAKIGEWTGAVHLTFVRANPSPPGRPEPDTFIRVGRVSVEHRE